MLKLVKYVLYIEGTILEKIMSTDRQELETKVIEIQEWLGSISGDLQNESYEINEFTVNYLYQLCQVST